MPNLGRCSVRVWILTVHQSSCVASWFPAGGSAGGEGKSRQRVLAAGSQIVRGVPLEGPHCRRTVSEVPIEGPHCRTVRGVPIQGPHCRKSEFRGVHISGYWEHSS